MDDLNRQYKKRLSKSFKNEKNRCLQNSLMLFMIMQNSQECQEQVLAPQSSSYEIDQYFNSKSQMTELLKKIDLRLQDQYFQQYSPQGLSSSSSISSAFQSENNQVQKSEKPGQSEGKESLKVKQNHIENSELQNSDQDKNQIDLEAQNLKRKFIEISNQENTEELIYKKFKSDETNLQENSEQPLQQPSINNSDDCKLDQKIACSQENIESKQIENESLQIDIQKQSGEQIFQTSTEQKENQKKANELEENKYQVVETQQVINIPQQYNPDQESSKQKQNEMIIESEEKKDIQEQQIEKDFANEIQNVQNEVNDAKLDKIESKNDGEQEKNDKIQSENEDAEIKKDNVEDQSNLPKEKETNLTQQGTQDSEQQEEEKQQDEQIVKENHIQIDQETNIVQNQANEENIDREKDQINKQGKEVIPQKPEEIRHEEQDEKPKSKSQIEIENENYENQDDNELGQENHDSFIYLQDSGCLVNKNETQKDQEDLQKQIIIENSQTNIELVKQTKNNKEDEESQTIVLKNNQQNEIDIIENQVDQQLNQNSTVDENKNDHANEEENKILENNKMQIEKNEFQSVQKSNQEEQIEIEQESSTVMKDNNQSEKNQVLLEIDDELGEIQNPQNQEQNVENKQQGLQQQEIIIQEDIQNSQEQKQHQGNQVNHQQMKEVIDLEEEEEEENDNQEVKNNPPQDIIENKYQVIQSQSLNEEQIDQAGGDDDEDVDPQDIINMYSLEFFIRKQKYLKDLQDKKQEEQKNQDALSHQNFYSQQNNFTSNKNGDQKNQSLRKQKEDIKCGIETKCANLKNDDIQKYIQPNSNQKQPQSQPNPQQTSNSAKSSTQKNKLAQNEQTNLQNQAMQLNLQSSSKTQPQQQNNQQEKAPKPVELQKSESKKNESKNKSNNQKKPSPYKFEKAELEQMQMQKYRMQQDQLSGQSQNQEKQNKISHLLNTQQNIQYQTAQDMQQYQQVYDKAHNSYQEIKNKINNSEKAQMSNLVYQSNEKINKQIQQQKQQLPIQQQQLQQLQQFEKAQQNQKLIEQRGKQILQSTQMTLNNLDQGKPKVRNNQQQQKVIIDIESSDDEQEKKDDKNQVITIDSEGKLGLNKNIGMDIRKIEKANNIERSSSIEITENPQKKSKQMNNLKQEKSQIMKQQTIDLEDDSDAIEASSKQQFIIQQQNQMNSSKKQQQLIEQQYQQNPFMIQQLALQQKYMMQQPYQQTQQVNISDDEESNNRQFNQSRVAYSTHLQQQVIPDSLNIQYQYQTYPQNGLQGSIHQSSHHPMAPQYITQYPQPTHILAPGPQSYYQNPFYPSPLQVVQSNLGQQAQGKAQLDELSIHGKDSNDDYYSINQQQQQFRSKELGKRDNGQKDRNNSANKNNSCDISSSESLQPQINNNKMLKSMQQLPISYQRQFISQGQIPLQPQNASHLNPQYGQFGMRYDMQNYIQQGYLNPPMASMSYPPYGPQAVPSANGACIIYGNQFAESQLQSEKEAKHAQLGGRHK